MSKITMAEAIVESTEGFSPRFYDRKYGDRMPIDLAGGELVYARTPFSDLNGTALQVQDRARFAADLGWIESGRPSAPTEKPAPFLFFEEV